MALPQLNTLTYELEVPTTKQKVKFRPFLVKEQKLLMMAQETGSNKEMLEAVCRIIKTCTFDEVKDPENLPTVDIEYMFLHIRGKSVGESFKVNLLCQDDGKTYVPVEIQLKDIKVDFSKKMDGNIKLNDEIGMTLKYPSVKDIMTIDGEASAVTVSMDIVKSTITNIYDSNEVYEEFTDKELEDFIDSLNSEQFDKLQEFYNTAPKLMHKVKITNPKTGVENEVELEGLQSFLD